LPKGRIQKGKRDRGRYKKKKEKLETDRGRLKVVRDSFGNGKG